VQEQPDKLKVDVIGEDAQEARLMAGMKKLIS